MNPLAVSLRQLEQDDALELRGEVDAAQLQIESFDEVIEIAGPLRYDLTVEMHGDALLVMGDLVLPLKCTCVRCLGPFLHEVELGGWSALAPLGGEEGLQILGDWVDLTPLLRDDVVLAFPQHPLCKPECSGLPNPKPGGQSASGTESVGGDGASQWAALDQLKL
jgi:uncharacterized protein